MSHSSELHARLDRPGRLLVVSPHFDDGVFGAGMLLAARPGAWLLTVAGGTPEDDAVLTDWDAGAGFASAGEAMAARRAEDAAAARLLDATPWPLDFPDAQYGPAPHEAQLAAALARVIDADAAIRLVAFPLGLFHSDHRLVREACLSLLDGWAALDWVAYEDAIYRRIGGAVQATLAELTMRGFVLTPVWPVNPAASAGVGAAAHGAEADTEAGTEAAARLGACAARKRAAVARYASQLRALAADDLADLEAPDRYWLIRPGDDDE